MTSKLQDKSIDLAIALTEGLVAGISKGQDWYKIVGTYVDAPLCKVKKKKKVTRVGVMTNFAFFHRLGTFCRKGFQA